MREVEWQRGGCHRSAVAPLEELRRKVHVRTSPKGVVAAEKLKRGTLFPVVAPSVLDQGARKASQAVWRFSDNIFAQPHRFLEKGTGEAKALWCNIASCVRIVEPDAVAREKTPPNCTLAHTNVVSFVSHGGRAEERVCKVPCVTVKEAIPKGAELVAMGNPNVWIPAERAADAAKRRAGGMLATPTKKPKAEDPFRRLRVHRTVRPNGPRPGGAPSALGQGWFQGWF